MKLFILVILFSLDAASSHKVPQGLFCVNDLVNNVSCTWHGLPMARGADCRVSGALRVRNRERKKVNEERWCQLQQHRSSPPGCSFAFENEMFNCFKALSYIHMVCDGTCMENITNYNPCNHIKMHPPTAPNVTKSANMTNISWTEGGPSSVFLTALSFEVQVKEEHQDWKNASMYPTSNKEMKIYRGQLKGHYFQVRVRVRPLSDEYISHWSDWSPTTSWSESTNRGSFVDLLVTLCVTGGLVLLLVVILILYRCCMRKRHNEMKLVPNPSKYFHTLYSVHEGNLKKWMNPLSTSEPFFTAQPFEQLSKVEVCDSWDVVASTSPSSTSTCALLHTKSCSSAGSITSGVIDCSSSMSSSCFSNMGYFTSSSPSSSAPSHPCPAYFIYQDDFHNVHSHGLPLSLCPSFNSSRVYESLKREPQSPDSGFGADNDKKDEIVDVKQEEDSAPLRAPPLLLLPLHLPSQISSFLPPPSPPHAPNPALVLTESLPVDDLEEAAAWPLAGAMCRSSSMPVEPCRTGYLTLKELQTTFSNKSI